MQSAIDYAKICNAVYTGVHATLIASERVACGGTAPRGNNNPSSSSRPSVSPLAFLRAVKKAGLKTFDAWAHHPYYASPVRHADDEAGRRAKGAPATAVTLGNLGDLIKLVTQLYGNKRIWITEYGYQTNPPDPIFGVSWRSRRRYLTQAFGDRAQEPAHRHDALVPAPGRAEPRRLAVRARSRYGGAKKPSFAAFEHLTH